MATYTHSWDRSQRDLSRRFLTGLVTALSFTLVAYEWRSGTHVSFLKTTLADEEHVVEDLPVNFTIKRDLIPSDSKVRTTASTGRIVASEPVAVPTLSPQANIQPDPTGGPEPLVTGPERLPDEVVDPGPRLWDGVEQRPYFATCLEEDRRDLDACTEARIDAHLQKHFRVPREMRREEFTVITMEVTASGGHRQVDMRPRAECGRESRDRTGHPVIADVHAGDPERPCSARDPSASLSGAEDLSDRTQRHAVRPPSTGRLTPLMYPPEGPHRKATALAISPA